MHRPGADEEHDALRIMAQHLDAKDAEIAKLNRRIEIAETVSGEAYDSLDAKDAELAELYSAIHWGKVAHKRMRQEITRLRQALQTIADTAHSIDARELAMTALEHSDR